ncbi:MAG: indole-3-glycerol-phosphate synthase [Deltaproteobacteria bacterium]|jgi:indole-3-glycerol phosphate synthase|nr:indole-3-glycerol-phosphate synthase [Deltaproteobacteria bacterium]
MLNKHDSVLLDRALGTDLGRFAEAKTDALARLRGLSDRGLLEAPGRAEFPPPSRPGFLAALERGRAARGLGVVAEYKRASPSLGDINLALSPEEAAREYARADCVSVLTEGAYFKGELDFVRRAAAAGAGPILRKDFLFHPLQVLETAGTPASAVLLIVRLTPDPALLKELAGLAVSRGLEPVVEVHGPGELETARRSGARLIQFNSRDLKSLEVDRRAALNLAGGERPLPGEFFIAASGVMSGSDLFEAAGAGFGAVLVGTALMSAEKPSERLDGMLAELGRLNGRGSPGGGPEGGRDGGGPEKRGGAENFVS